MPRNALGLKALFEFFNASIQFVSIIVDWVDILLLGLPCPLLVSDLPIDGLDLGVDLLLLSGVNFQFFEKLVEFLFDRVPSLLAICHL